MCTESVIGPGAHASIRSMSAVLWGSWAEARLVNSNQKNRVSVTWRGSYIRGVPGAGPGRWGDC